MAPHPFFASVRRRMSARYALPWLIRAFAASLLGAAAILLLARAIALSSAAPLAAALGLVLACAVAGIGWWRRPSTAAALRRADRLMGLRDRLTTAWEFAGQEAPILQLQRAELAQHTSGLDLRRALPLRLGRRDTAAPLAGAAVLGLALLLPYPASHTAVAHASSRTQLKHAAARVQAARHTTGTLPPHTLNALPKGDQLRQAQIARVLAQLQRSLAAARTPAQALKAIAHAQDALNRLAVPNVGAQRAALNALASSLSHSSATQSLARALRSGNPTATRKAFQNLQQQLNHLSPAQRASLARALQAAANAAAPDANLSSSLQNAATSLAQGDTAGTRSALNAAAQRSAADQARSAQQQALDQANSALDAARNDAAGLPDNQSSAATPGSTSKNTGKAGQAGQGNTGQASSSRGNQGAGNSPGSGAHGGKGQSGAKGNGAGQGKGGARGSGAGQGQGQSGGGQGQGAASGSGQGQGQGAGSGSGAGAGQGGGQGAGGARGGNANGGNSGNAPGNRVFIPAAQGQGPSSSTNGPQGQPTGGSLRPWREVLPSYERSARNSLESGTLPPQQQALVKQYFDHLSH